MKSILLSLLLLVGIFFCISSASRIEWGSHGGDSSNARYRGHNKFLDSNSAPLLVQQWSYPTRSYVTNTPAIGNDLVYVCDHPPGGYLYAINNQTGLLAWEYKLSLATNIAGEFCRATPTLTHDGLLLVGTQKSGHLLKFNALTGVLLDKILLNTHPSAIVTQGGSLWYRNIVVSCSSSEEANSAAPGYQCCTFRGSVHLVNIDTFARVWDWSPIPDDQYLSGLDGVSGVGVWGASPPINFATDTVYIGTGNPYSIPQYMQDCQAADPTSDSCIPASVLYNAIVALDLNTGTVKCSQRYSAYDAWVVGCLFAPPGSLGCPNVPGPDADFGMAPIIVWDKQCGQSLAVSQKSGITWFIDMDTCKNFSSVQTGPGGPIGGSSWGAASDNEGYYVGSINSAHLPFDLIQPANKRSSGGWWNKINLTTHQLECQIEVPTPNDALIQGASAAGPPTLVNDLWLATSTVPVGPNFFVFNKNTCEPIISFATGSSVYGGPSVAGKCIYLGTGYNPILNPLWTPTPHSINAYCIP
jgi:polyvinyl alcohol dehydrogenase (cytochrome)